jgi:hypothetical protein
LRLSSRRSGRVRRLGLELGIDDVVVLIDPNHSGGISYSSDCGEGSCGGEPVVVVRVEAIGITSGFTFAMSSLVAT